MVCIDNRHSLESVIVLQTVNQPTVGIKTFIRNLQTVDEGGSKFHMVSNSRESSVNINCNLTHYFVKDQGRFAVACADQTTGNSVYSRFYTNYPQQPEIQNSILEQGLWHKFDVDTFKEIKNPLAMTKIPSGDEHFAVIDEGGSFFVFGGALRISSPLHPVLKKILIVQGSTKFILSDVDNLAQSCLAGGKAIGSSENRVFYFNCNYQTTFDPFSHLPASVDISSTFLPHSSVTKEMAFTIAKKGLLEEYAIIYTQLGTGVHNIFIYYLSNPAILDPILFPQTSHLFSEQKIKLQSMSDFYPLVFVINGSKSLSLINWVYSQEIQTWRSSSTTPKLSGCISGDKIVILEIIPETKSIIRSYKIKPQPGTNGEKICNTEQNRCAACLPNSRLDRQSLYNSILNCQSACSIGYYSYLGETCLPCHHECQMCFGPKNDNCLSCNDGFLLNSNSTCYPCTSGQYLAGYGSSYYRMLQEVYTQNQYENYTCSLCTLNCQECDIQSCKICVDGYYLTTGGCFIVPVDGLVGNFYNQNLRVMQPCHSSCRTCNGPFSTNCLSCGANMTHQPYSNTCILSSSCKEGMSLINGTCEICHPSCRFCSNQLEDGCLSCWSWSMLSSNRCASTCDPNKTNQNGICKLCPPMQYQQDSSCVTTCQIDRILDTTSGICCNGCQTCYGPNNTNCITCPATKFLNGNTCQQCNSLCASCYGANQDNCSSCISPKVLSNGNCLDVITCDSSCATCSGQSSNQCTSCQPERYLHMNYCLLTCPIGTFVDGQYCTACSSNCLSCTSSTVCSQCNSNTYLLGTSCVNSCPSTVPSNPQVCCHPECGTCFGPLNDQCNSCFSPRALHFGICKNSCPIAMQNQSNVCVDITCHPDCASCQFSK